jgi:hypothetical protein
MRRGFPSLARLVQESLKRDPHAGDLYVFRGRRGDLITRSFGMTARARVCSRSGWSTAAFCGHRWRTALSRSALRNYPISCPELTGRCRRQPGVRRFPVKLWLIDSRRKSGRVFSGEYGGIVIVTTPSDPPLPADLAAAHAMILAQRSRAQPRYGFYRDRLQSIRVRPPYNTQAKPDAL